MLRTGVPDSAPQAFMIFNNTGGQLSNSKHVLRGSEPTFSEGQVTKGNKITGKIMHIHFRDLQFHNSSRSSAKLVSDISFANNDALSSQLGHNLPATDQTGYTNILSYASWKFKRVARSVFRAKMFVFADC